ncbi:hypothetical protein [Streptomyces boncukensis]|uniref:Uncharacterized protein n=1 Tax=Streptomyces boncukensis TaxID=2711219 RepID=A0A6G4WTD8_9ACTN|nr:hypothetical protein [Streptomyces boncukensis]NGO68536.1 hypothetical protein [Streptomyces boncukensis]
MVDRAPKGETLREIADRHGRSYDTVRKQWARHPDWPAPIGKRGRWHVYDSAAVDRVIGEHFARPAVQLQPRRLYTAQQLEEAGAGITAGTIRADLSRGRWPQPDSTDDGVNRWYGTTATAALAQRRSYKRSVDGTLG